MRNRWKKPDHIALGLMALPIHIGLMLTLLSGQWLYFFLFMLIWMLWTVALAYDVYEVTEGRGD